MAKLVLPARMLSVKVMDFPINNKWGYGLKIAIRNVAKTLPLYRTPVTIEPLVTGRSDNGDEIPINNLGRWLFGVPGYMGHIQVLGGAEYVSLRIPNVPEAEQLVIQAVEQLVG